MLYFNNLLSHDIIFELHKQIIDFIYNSRRGIFNGKHRKISASLFDRTAGIPEGIHMEAVNRIPEILMHGCLGVSSLRTLEHDAHPVVP